MQYLKPLMITVVSVFLISRSVFALQDDNRVQIGHYTLENTYIYTSMKDSTIEWCGIARNGNQSFPLQITFPGSDSCTPEQMWEEYKSWEICRDIGNGVTATLHYRLSFFSKYQRQHSLYEEVGKPECSAIVNLQGSLLTVWSDIDINVKRMVDSIMQVNAQDAKREELSDENVIEKSRAAILTKILANPITDSICCFLNRFKMLPDTFTTFCFYDGVPEVFSKNTTGTYVSLGRSAKSFHDVPDVYELHKSEGDSVDLKLCLKTKVYIVTANGISISEKKGGETNIHLRIRQYGVSDAHHEFVTTFSPEGIALVHIPKLIGSTMLVAEISDVGHQESRAYKAYILLRRTKQGADSLPLYVPTAVNSKFTARAILVEMNNMFDSDRSGWYRNSYGNESQFKPNTYAVKLLSELPEYKFPNLAKIALTEDTLQWFVTMAMPFVTECGFPKKINIDSFLISYNSYAGGLAESLVLDTIEGWHDPEAVFRMAILCRDFPQLCSRLPLKNIFDLWCRLIPVMPVPLKSEYYANGGSRVVKDTDPFSIVYAIAALKTGAHIFRDTSFVSAIDLLHNIFSNTNDTSSKYFTKYLIDVYNPNYIEKHYFKLGNACAQVGLLTGDSLLFNETKNLMSSIMYGMYKNSNSAMRDMYRQISFFDRTLIVMNLLNHSVENIQFPYSIFTPYK